jgi:hypothetical protein
MELSIPCAAAGGVKINFLGTYRQVYKCSIHLLYIQMSAEEPNPEWLGGQEAYDCAVLGTGLKECILSGLLSVDGYKASGWIERVSRSKMLSKQRTFPRPP